MMRARLYPFPAKGLMRINEITSCSIIKNDDDCFKKLIKYLFFFFGYGTLVMPFFGMEWMWIVFVAVFGM